MRTVAPDVPVAVPAYARFIESLVAASDLGESVAPMLDVALALVRGGWRVFPCDAQSKRPLITGGFYGRSAEPAQVDGWWGDHPTATVGLVPADGGLIALDGDSALALGAIERAGLLPDGLLEALGTGALETHHGLVVATGGSSEPFEFRDVRVPPLHLYLRVPDGAPPVAIPDVVCRFDRGYVIAPGSLGRRRYRVVGRGEPLPFNPITDPAPSPERVDAGPEPSSQRAPDRRRLAEAVACIPNDEGTDRDYWVKMAHAIKGAVGPEGDEEGLQLFLTWSARWPGGDDPEADERLYRTIDAREVRAGWETIWREAAKYGFNATLEIQQSAQEVFSAEGTAPPPAPEERKPNTGHTLGELLQRPELFIPPTPAIPCLAWPGLKTLLSGREKTGKSTFALAGAAAASRGGPFLDEAVPARTVLWVTEEPLAIIAQRAAAMQGDVNRFVILPMEARPPEQLHGAVARWKPQIVVIDTLYRYALVEDENEAGAWLPVFRRLDEITRGGAALLLLVHAAKSSHHSEYRGSTAIAGHVDVMLAMTAPDVGKTRNLKAVGRIPVQDFRVQLGDDQTSFSLLGKPDGDAALKRAIAAYLEANGPTAASRLRRQLGVGHPKVMAVLGALIADGRVMRENGRYRLTTAAEAFDPSEAT